MNPANRRPFAWSTGSKASWVIVVLRRDGRPDAPTERNFFYGSSYDFEGVSGSTLPGIRFNLDRGRVADSEREATIYLEALGHRVEGLHQLRQGTREDH